RRSPPASGPTSRRRASSIPRRPPDARKQVPGLYMGCTCDVRAPARPLGASVGLHLGLLDHLAPALHLALEKGAELRRRLRRHHLPPALLHMLADRRDRDDQCPRHTAI